MPVNNQQEAAADSLDLLELRVVPEEGRPFGSEALEGLSIRPAVTAECVSECVHSGRPCGKTSPRQSTSSRARRQVGAVQLWPEWESNVP